MKRLLLVGLCALAWTSAEAAADPWYTQRWRNEARSGPGTYFGLTGTLNKGVPVKVLQTQGDWIQFTVSPITAWMAKSSLAPTPPKDSVLDSLQKLRAKFSGPAMNTTAVAAVRGFALRYGRAKGSDLNALNAVAQPPFTPSDYAAFKNADGAPKPTTKALSSKQAALLSDYDPALQEEGSGLGIAAVVASAGLNKDAALLRYVNMLGTLLAESSGAYATAFKIYVTNAEQVNALSVPGGYIFLSRKLISACQNEAELAAVIAHEMTHITRRHGLKEVKARATNIHADEAMAELDAEAGAGPDPAAEKELEDFADAAFEAVHKPRLQAYEEEADKGALLILARAGYDPAAVPRMIERVGAVVSKDAENPFAKMDYKKRKEQVDAFLKQELASVSGAANAPRFQKETSGQ